MTVAVVLREILPHIANPIEVSVTLFEVQVKVHEQIRGRTESLNALPHLIEMVQKFHDYLLVLRKIMVEKIEEDTEISFGTMVFVGEYIGTDPRLSDEQRIEKRRQDNATISKVEEIGEAGKADVEKILTYQIDRISKVLAGLRSMQVSV